MMKQTEKDDVITDDEGGQYLWIGQHRPSVGDLKLEAHNRVIARQTAVGNWLDANVTSKPLMVMIRELSGTLGISASQVGLILADPEFKPEYQRIKHSKYFWKITKK